MRKKRLLAKILMMSLTMTSVFWSVISDNVIAGMEMHSLSTQSNAAFKETTASDSNADYVESVYESNIEEDKLIMDKESIPHGENVNFELFGATDTKNLEFQAADLGENAELLDIEYEHVIAHGTLGDNLTWSLSNSGTMVISGIGEMVEISNEDLLLFKFHYSEKIRSVVIKNGVTSISNNVFRECSSLTEVVIPNSVTSIGNSAFEGCGNLIEVIIPNSVTSIGNNAFRGCSSLTKVTISNSVSSINDNTFEECSSLTKVIIPNNVTSIGSGAFTKCSSLTEVTIPDSVTSIGSDVFKECSSLMEVIIPDSVTDIGVSAFKSCDSLAKITLCGI